MPLTYAVGDIHGCLDKLKSLVAACREHAAGREMQFVFLGDYIDRGPDPAGVVRFLMSLQTDMQERMIALKGNHEAWALEFVGYAWPGTSWLRNGGIETLVSYAAETVDDLPSAHLQWMSGLRLTYDDGRRFFVHAGLDPKRPLDDQDEEDLLWMREPFLSDDRDYGRLIVHGHTPVADGRPDLRSNRLNVDTGAFLGGPLTAALFDDSQTEPAAFLQSQ
jgi:serine/threonine protein phosphatase 1